MVCSERYSLSRKTYFLSRQGLNRYGGKKKQGPLLGEKTGMELLFAQATTPIKVKL